MIRLLKLGFVSFLIGFLLHRFFNLVTGITFTALIIVVLLVFSKKIQSFYMRLERRFFNNLNQREIATAEKNRTELAPWNAHMVPLTVPPDAPCVGKTLQELLWRESIGINIVMIKRGDYHIAAPTKADVIYPRDELLILGTDRQIQRLRVLMRPEVDSAPGEVTDVELYEHTISEGSVLVNKTIRETGLRERANALVVGVERNNERLLNPESNFVLAANDTLFIVGNRRKLKPVLKNPGVLVEQTGQIVAKQWPLADSP